VSVGLVGYVAFHGAGRAVGHSTFSAIFDVVAGVAAVGFAAGVQRGGLAQRPGKGDRGTSSLAARLRRPSAKLAAVAGVVTHVPGLIYVVALNAIASTAPGPARAFVDIVIYNLLWFTVPVAALAVAVRSPETAVAYLDRLSAWARRHQEQLLVALFGALGVYLIVKGTLELT
jgi:hypothetical protein